MHSFQCLPYRQPNDCLYMPPGLHAFPSTLSMIIICLNESLAVLLINSNVKMTSTLNDSLNIDLVNTTAYPTISALPKTQGPICLYVLQYDEKLDWYYSS
ncbi:unnamed protein product [Adineta steineri]|uniref:Uncharacterized protein n=1 Tax=Adineta steineri TaxID=433720 RepID=A0A815RJU5_9BILA|nr:unnamed protein product [Adineta steineri]CAF1477749.1 unnamed protein product [Adineta steineri]